MFLLWGDTGQGKIEATDGLWLPWRPKHYGLYIGVLMGFRAFSMPEPQVLTVVLNVWITQG